MAKIDSCGPRPRHCIYLPPIKSKPGTRPSTPHLDKSHDRRPSTVPDEVLRAFSHLQNTTPRSVQERRRTFEQIRPIHDQRRAPQMLRTITSGDDSNDHSEEQIDAMDPANDQTMQQATRTDGSRFPPIKT